MGSSSDTYQLCAHGQITTAFGVLSVNEERAEQILVHRKCSTNMSHMHNSIRVNPTPHPIIKAPLAVFV